MRMPAEGGRIAFVQGLVTERELDVHFTCSEQRLNSIGDSQNEA